MIFQAQGEKLLQAARQTLGQFWQAYILPDFEHFKERVGRLVSSVHDWLGVQSPQSRQLLKYGSFLVFVLFGYLLLWAPLHLALDQAETAHQRSVSTRNYLEENPPTYSESEGQSLATALINSAKAAGVVLSQLQPGDNNASVAIEGVGFAALLSWLEGLERLGVARIDTLIINPSNEDDKLVVRLTLIDL